MSVIEPDEPPVEEYEEPDEEQETVDSPDGGRLSRHGQRGPSAQDKDGDR